jgi:hypothetical protein
MRPTRLTTTVMRQLLSWRALYRKEAAAAHSRNRRQLDPFVAGERGEVEGTSTPSCVFRKHTNLAPVCGDGTQALRYIRYFSNEALPQTVLPLVGSQDARRSEAGPR